MDILWFSSPISSRLFLRNALPKISSLLSSPQQQLSVPLDTDSCLNYKGSIVSNEATEISSYRVTWSYPEQPPLTLNPHLWASPNELFIYYSQIRMRRAAGTGVLWRSALHANMVLQSLSPTNQQFCSKLICIQCSHILPMCTVWKYKFHSSPVCHDAWEIVWNLYFQSTVQIRAVMYVYLPCEAKHVII